MVLAQTTNMANKIIKQLAFAEKMMETSKINELYKEIEIYLDIKKQSFGQK